MAVLFQDLMDSVTKLSLKDKAFADSILNQWQKRGSISDKQQHWASVLVDRANGVVPANASKPVTQLESDLSVIAGMFAHAAKHLKRPKIKLQNGASLVALSLATGNTRNPGFIYVKVDGEYRGKVSPTGEYTGDPVMIPFLNSIAGDPAKIAANHGHTTGNCCFCGLTLSDARSVTVGYGPICADHYGLAWG
jgi:hypothetical protein